MDEFVRENIKDWVWWALARPHQIYGIFPFEEANRWIRFLGRSERTMNAKVQAIVDKLSKGEKVINKEGGNSMTPLIQSKQPCTLEAVDTSLLEVNDIVYVKVHGNVYTHKVTALREGQVQIGNNHGHINGWTKLENVYAIVTEIDGKEISGAKEKVKK